MDIHAITEYEPFDVNEFEADAVYGRRGLIPQIQPRYRYPYFLHIFDGAMRRGTISIFGRRSSTKTLSGPSNRPATYSTVRLLGNSGRCFRGAVRRTV